MKTMNFLKDKKRKSFLSRRIYEYLKLKFISYAKKL